MRSKPRGWVARNVIDGLVVLAVLVGSLWVIPRGIGGRERAEPPAAATATTVPLPGVPSDVAATTKASVWVAMTNGQVLEIDAARGHVMGLVDTGGPLGFTQTIALGAGSAELVSRLDPELIRS